MSVHGNGGAGFWNIIDFYGRQCQLRVANHFFLWFCFIQILFVFSVTCMFVYNISKSVDMQPLDLQLRQ